MSKGKEDKAEDKGRISSELETYSGTTFLICLINKQLLSFKPGRFQLFISKLQRNLQMQNNDAGVRDLKSLEGWGGDRVREDVGYRNAPEWC